MPYVGTKVIRDSPLSATYDQGWFEVDTTFKDLVLFVESSTVSSIFITNWGWVRLIFSSKILAFSFRLSSVTSIQTCSRGVAVTKKSSQGLWRVICSHGRVRFWLNFSLIQSTSTDCDKGLFSLLQEATYSLTCSICTSLRTFGRPASLPPLVLMIFASWVQFKFFGVCEQGEEVKVDSKGFILLRLGGEDNSSVAPQHNPDQQRQ